MMDPVCGMEVGGGSKFSSRHGGRMYFFCSAQCKKSFDSAPGRYAKV